MTAVWLRPGTWIRAPSSIFRQAQGQVQCLAAVITVQPKRANSLTWTLSAEFAPNIRVNGVMPGAIPTEVMLQAVGKNEDQLDELLEEWRIPLGRLGTPQDIGSVCVYLASEAASWVSGEIIRVGGGAKPR